MAVILWQMLLSLLMQSCLCSIAQMNTGCMSWYKNGNNVCCMTCHPGNRLVTPCGLDPNALCKPCEHGTYAQKPNKDFQCSRCTQCAGAQVSMKPCTAISDTQCGCRDGLLCGDDRCNFCIKKCDKGYEPTEDSSCRPCRQGTFNDQPQHKCKPFSTKCPKPGQYIKENGTQVSDIKCANVSLSPSQNPENPDNTDAWPLVLSLVTCLALMCLTVIIIITAAVKIFRKNKKSQKMPTKTPIIRAPTDDPRTLIAIECSFHEAQQEQGSSLESLNSKDSTEQLIA